MFNALKIRMKTFQSMHYIVILFAVVVQIQVTLFADGDYLGLRVSLGDLLIPFVGVFVVFSLLRKKTSWPHWSIPFMLIWIVALSFIMSLALYNGYVTNGFLSSWAFVNKYIGFFLLLSYLMLGGWIVTNVSNKMAVLRLFMCVFTSFYILTVFMSALLLFLQYFIPFPLWLADYPWDGFMANRNAFVVIFILAFTFVIWSDAEGHTFVPFWLSMLFWLCLPMFFVFNESRTGWIVSAVLAVIFFAKNPIKRGVVVLPILLLGTLITYSSYYMTTAASSSVKEGWQMRYMVALVVQQDELDYHGDQRRYTAVEDGLELYQQHNFITGAGLGTYRPFQIQKRGEFVDIMDFTGLWLLVETGALGLLMFAAFYLVCMHSVYRVGFVDGHSSSSYHRAFLVFLILFAGISVLHELMYTRALWFALGLGMVAVMDKHKSKGLV